MSEIVSGLHLGSVWLAEDEEWLMEYQITHVLSICNLIPSPLAIPSFHICSILNDMLSAMLG